MLRTRLFSGGGRNATRGDIKPRCRVLFVLANDCLDTEDGGAFIN